MNPSPSLRQALIPLAAPQHQGLPLQSILGPDGRPVPVLIHQINALLAAGIEEVGLIVSTAVQALAAPVVASFGSRVTFLWQKEPKGFGHALWCAREWVGREPVLVQVCDHVFLSASDTSCVRQVIDAWEARGASICAVQRVREAEVSRSGIVSGKRVEGSDDTFLLQTFVEKPSLTKAELLPHVAGLGSSEYLSSAGLFALTPEFFDLLGVLADRREDGLLRWLAPAFTELMRRQSLYGLEFQGRRINLEEPLGLLRAQVALGLASPDRDQVLSLLLEESIRLQGTKNA